MLLNHISERLRFEDYSTRVAGRLRPRWAAGAGRRRAASRRVPSRGGTAHLALRGARTSWWSGRSLMPYGQNSVHVTYRLRRGQGSRAPDAASAARVPAARRSRRSRAGAGLHADRPRSPHRDSGRRSVSAASARARTRLRAPSPLTTTRSPTSDTSSKSIAATSRRVRCGARATSAPQLAPGRDVTLIASTESWETIAAINPVEALATERDRAHAPRRRRAPGGALGRCRRARARRRPVHHQALVADRR